MDPAQTLFHYHQTTKHHYHRYARSAGYMDWENQPNPFRRFEGVEPIRLPLTAQAPAKTYDALFAAGHPEGRSLDLECLGLFLRYSMGLSAWKAAGASRWSLRMNPSSGNLHPTECYAVTPRLGPQAAAVYHYSPLLHSLEPRALLPDELWTEIEKHFGGRGFLVGLTSIFWRESWKYGERALRYCNLDTGHALAALALAARLNQWRLFCLGAAGDDQIAKVLGSAATTWPPLEEEAPDLICWVSTHALRHSIPQNLAPELVRVCCSLTFAGRPNRLSARARDWPIIAQAAQAAFKPPVALPEAGLTAAPFRYAKGPSLPATRVLARRRSAVRFDPTRHLPGDDFRAILERTLARRGVMPFDLGLGPPQVNLLLFVHRVQEVRPGLYLLLRAADHEQALRTGFHRRFAWQRADAHLPLWLLHPGQVTAEAMSMSCHQEIAGQSAFAVAMLAAFAGPVSRQPFCYRHLHWECGLIGQVLYLEAEARGARGTGIGCFFDDGVHEYLGLDDASYQILYHFTVGYPIEDPRLSMLPAYHHLSV